MWTDIFFLVLYYKPVAMGRPRFNMQTGRIYLPNTTKQAIQTISKQIRQKIKADALEQITKPTPVFVELIFVHSRPKSHKTTQNRSPKFTRPDIDNLAKTYLDGITKSGLWEDDSQVTCLKCQDLYGYTNEPPHVIIKIATWEHKTDQKLHWLHHPEM